ncbi:MAG: glycosyltransferase family 2 protein [Candidatus Omnitrophota bacterium]
MKISVVIPVYNGARTISKLVEDLLGILKAYQTEIILVNDGSKDKSHDLCLSIYERHKANVKYICLARNFGEHNAVMAGLNQVTGDYAVTIDDDFQNPPEEIPKLLDKAVSEGLDVVYSYYEKKRHSFMRNAGSSFNNAIANLLLDKPKDLYLSSFRCMSRFIAEEVVKYKGPYPYVDGLILRSTGNIGKVLVRHASRAAGRSGYTFHKLVRLWINMFINFSIFPLRASTLLGFLFLIIGVLSSISMIIEKIINPAIPMGITTILVAILLFGGIQLLILGLIGEYLGKLFLMDNRTPQYVVRRLFSNDKDIPRA